MEQINRFFSRIRLAFLYYKRKGYWHFIGTNTLLIIALYALVVIGVILLGKYVLNLRHIFQTIIDNFTDTQVITLFIISESFLGMIPPDLFMLWAEKFEDPLQMLTILGILSYAGGIISYGLGFWIAKQSKIKAYIENRLKKYIGLTQRWGGAFLAIAALFPFSPFAMVALAVSMLKYPFPKLLLYGLFRILRFIAQGTLLIKLLQFDFG